MARCSSICSSATIPFGGRQGYYFSGVQFRGSVGGIAGQPIWVADQTCIASKSFSCGTLTTTAGPQHAPVIAFAGLLGSLGDPCSVSMTLPAAPSVALLSIVSFSSARIYASTALPFSVSSGLGAGGRNKVDMRRSFLEGSGASSFDAGNNVDLDMRDSTFSQATIASTGNGGLDRDFHSMAANVPVGLSVTAAITPPFPPSGSAWYPTGASYRARLQPTTAISWGVSASTASSVTFVGSVAATATAYVERNKS